MSSELTPHKAGGGRVIGTPDEMARAMGVPPGPEVRGSLQEEAGGAGFRIELELNPTEDPVLTVASTIIFPLTEVSGKSYGRRTTP